MNAQRRYAPVGSSAVEPNEIATVRLPPMRVRTNAPEVARFLRETGGDGDSGFVPLTFPFRWLGLPDVRSLIVRLTGSGNLPIHEAQIFSYERELQVESDYVLVVEASASRNPARLELRIEVSTPQGENCVRIETVLRIVRAVQGQAP
jgi:hypothetical protein